MPGIGGRMTSLTAVHRRVRDVVVEELADLHHQQRVDAALAALEIVVVDVGEIVQLQTHLARRRQRAPRYRAHTRAEDTCHAPQATECEART